MDVGGWLRRLGLEQYEAAFRENDIDETVLPSLTHENLKELGVASLGHRVKLLDAVAALRTEASAPTPVSAVPLESDNTAKDSAERRQVTVMFSDLVGSTALSARMNARSATRRIFNCVGPAVARGDLALHQPSLTRDASRALVALDGRLEGQFGGWGLIQINGRDCWKLTLPMTPYTTGASLLLLLGDLRPPL
jgi:hypothetical protein